MEEWTVPESEEEFDEQFDFDFEKFETESNNITGILNASFPENGVSGICGDNISWTLNNEGILLLTGFGDMYNYDSTSIVDMYYLFVNKIIIGNGITSIGDYSFYGCSAVTSVEIYSSVESIGRAAFAGCSALSEVLIPESVMNIGPLSFSKCSSLKSVSLMGQIDAIGDSAFSECISLESVFFEGNIEVIGNSMFSNCSSLLSVSLPNSVTQIGECAFFNCVSLTSVTLSDSISSIGAWAFAQCHAISKIIFPPSIDIIDEGAFFQCSSLQSVVFPESLTQIGCYAFWGCDKLTNAYFLGDSPNQECTENCDWLFNLSVLINYQIGTDGWSNAIWSNYSTRIFTYKVLSSIEITTLPQKTEYKVNEVFDKAGMIVTAYFNDSTSEVITDYQYSPQGFITLQNNVLEVSYSCFNIEKTASVELSVINECIEYTDQGQCGDDVYWTFTEDGILSFLGYGDMYDYSADFCPWISYREGIKTIDICDGITSIGSAAFTKCPSLSSVTIPNSVHSIGTIAFSFCSSLESIILPEYLREIDKIAFRGCSCLNSVYFLGDAPTLVEQSSYMASFDDVTLFYRENKQNWTSQTYCGYEVELYQYKELSSIEITALPFKTAYKTNERFNPFGMEITAFFTDGSSEIITDYSYSPNTLLSSPNTGIIVSYSFFNIEKSTVLPITVSEDAESYIAKGTCGPNAMWILNENGVLTIWGSGIMSNYYDDTDIPWHIYRNKIKEIIICSGITSIGSGAFQGCTKLKSIEIPKSVNRIGSQAFYCCNSLSSISIPDSVATIEDYAFINCMELSSVYFMGNAPTVNENYFPFDSNVTLYYINGNMNWDTPTWNKYKTAEYIPPEYPLSFIKVTTNPNKTEYHIGELFDSDGIIVTAYYENDFSEVITGYILSPLCFLSTQDTEISVKYSLFGITKTTTVPISVTEWPESIIDYGVCGDYVSWTLDENDLLIIDGYGDMYSFSDNYGYEWYPYSSDIKSILIKNGVTSIGDYAFDEFESVESVTFEANSTIAEIGQHAFYGCNLLSSIIFPSSLTSIGNWAFSSEIILEFMGNAPQCSSYSFNNKSIVLYTYGTSGWSTNNYVWNGMPAFPNNFGFEYSGSCGTKLKYKVSIDERKLTISGSGEMTRTPWTPVALLINTVEIMSGATSIMSSAFSSHKHLISVTIPDTVTKIENDAFVNCSSLSEIIVNSTNSLYSSEDGILFNKDKTTIYVYPSGKIDSSYSLPDSTTTVSEYAFYGCKSLENIICDSNSQISFIGSYAFAKCTSLTFFTLPTSINIINPSTFEWCTSLSSINIPSTVTEICSNAFQNCKSLGSVKFENDSKLKTIGDYSFNNCTRLDDIIIPVEVSTIGDAAFYQCSKLKFVYFLGNAPDVSVNSFDSDNVTLFYLDNMSGWTFPIWNGFPTNMYSFNMDMDLNGDMKTDVCDVIVLKSKIDHYSGLIPSPSDSLKIYDVNDDGLLNIADIQFIIHYILNSVWTQSGDWNIDTPYSHITDIILNTSTVDISVGEKFELKFDAYPKSVTTEGFNWTSSDNSIATVDSNGVIKGIKVGTVLVSINGNHSGVKTSCMVTVTNDGESNLETLKNKIIEASILLERADVTTDIAKTDLSQLINATNEVIRSSNFVASELSEKISSINKAMKKLSNTMFNNTDLKKAVNDIESEVEISLFTEGSYKVFKNACNEAYYLASVNTAKESEFIACVINVQEKFEALTLKSVDIAKITSILLTDSTIDLTVNQKYTILFDAYPKTVTNETYTWTSSNETVASVNASGIVTGLNPGTSLITITGDKSGVYASCAVTVKNKAAEAIAISEPTVTLATIGATKQISAVLTPSDSNEKVTWSSSYPTIVSVTDTGLITALGSGIVTITATTESGKSATCTVYSVYNNGGGTGGTVSGQTKVSIGVYVAASGNLRNGTQYSAYLTFSPSMTATQLATCTFALTSDDSRIASVSRKNESDYSQNSFIITPGEDGLATLTGFVLSTDNSLTFEYSSTTVSVNSPSSDIKNPIKSISLSTTSSSVYSGDSVTIIATPTYSNSNTPDDIVSWSSSDTSVVKISATNLVCVAEAVGVGTAIITCRSKGNLSINGKTATCKITVKDTGSVDNSRRIISVSVGTPYTLSLSALGISGTILGVTPATASSVFSVGNSTVNNTTSWVINVSDSAQIGDTLDIYINYLDSTNTFSTTNYKIVVMYNKPIFQTITTINLTNYVGNIGVLSSKYGLPNDVTYSSNNTDVVKITDSSSGGWEAVTYGIATVAVKDNTTNKVFLNFKFTIEKNSKNPITKISLSSSSSTVYLGSDNDYLVLIADPTYYSDTLEKDDYLSWSSSDTSIAQIEQVSNSICLVKAIGIGTATIICKSHGSSSVNSISATCSLRVNNTFSVDKTRHLIGASVGTKLTPILSDFGLTGTLIGIIANSASSSLTINNNTIVISDTANIGDTSNITICYLDINDTYTTETYTLAVLNSKPSSNTPVIKRTVYIGDSINLSDEFDSVLSNIKYVSDSLTVINIINENTGSGVASTCGTATVSLIDNTKNIPIVKIIYTVENPPIEAVIWTNSVYSIYEITGFSANNIKSISGNSKVSVSLSNQITTPSSSGSDKLTLKMSDDSIVYVNLTIKKPEDTLSIAASKVSDTVTTTLQTTAITPSAASISWSIENVDSSVSFTKDTIIETSSFANKVALCQFKITSVETAGKIKVKATVGGATKTTDSISITQ